MAVNIDLTNPDIMAALKELIAIMDPEDRLAGMPPEQRLMGLAPKEIVAALPLEAIELIARKLKS